MDRERNSCAKATEGKLLELDWILGSCTSRFNGYKYREIEYLEKKQRFDYSELMKNFQLFSSEADNWLAYFLLNREMHFSSGPFDDFSMSSPMRLAIYFLFLHIYRLEPPIDYRNPNSSWQSLDTEDIEEYASLIRRYLVQVKVDK